MQGDALTPLTEVQRRARYLLVGSIGFITDAGLLSLLVHIFEFEPILSRAPSFLTAVSVTWVLNRRHTFAGRVKLKKTMEYRRYLLVQIIGALTNLLVYVLLIVTLPWLSQVPVLPLSVGAVLGLVVNYQLSCVFVFPRQANE